MNPDLFTVTEAIMIQSEHIAQWKTVLTESAYNRVVARARLEHQSLQKCATGRDVWRGSDITAFIRFLGTEAFYSK